MTSPTVPREVVPVAWRFKYAEQWESMNFAPEVFTGNGDIQVLTHPDFRLEYAYAAPAPGSVSDDVTTAIEAAHAEFEYLSQRSLTQPYSSVDRSRWIALRNITATALAVTKEST